MLTQLKQNIFNYFFWKDPYPFIGYQRKCHCIFIHIPKSAGTSILYQLNDGLKIPRRHNLWSEYRNRSAKRFNEFFKFSFVRNPWDRAVSTYFFLKQFEDPGSRDGREIWQEPEGERWDTFDLYVENFINKDNIWKHRLFTPQWAFIYDHMYDLQVDFLGRFENLDNDFRYVKSKIGLKAPELEKVNATPRKDYRYYYSEKSYNIISEIYSKDIELLGYKFE